MPNFHASGGKNIFENFEIAKGHCRRIAQEFHEILFRFHDCGATRLVMRYGNYWLPLSAEELVGWIARFFDLDGYFEEDKDQAQKLYGWLLGPESTLRFAN